MSVIGGFFKKIGAWIAVAAVALAGIAVTLWRAAVRREKAAVKRADEADERSETAGRALDRTIQVETRDREIRHEAQTQKELAAEKLARELQAIDAIGEAAINNPSDTDLVLEEANRRLNERRKAGKP